MFCFHEVADDAFPSTPFTCSRPPRLSAMSFSTCPCGKSPALPTRSFQARLCRVPPTPPRWWTCLISRSART